MRRSGASRPELAIVAGLAVLLAATIVSAAEERHPFTARDLHEIRRIAEPVVSPDGRTVAFSLRTTDWDADRGRYDLWAVDRDGSPPRRLTTDPAADTSPSWSPDGKSLYFLSSRSGSSQVWRLPVDGGEAVQVTDLPLDVNGYLLSPDGKSLAVALEVFPDCETLQCTVDRLEEGDASPVSGRVYERVFVRHWDHWKDGRRSHLFVVPVSGGEPKHVMRGMDADSPSKPFGGMEEVAFTPDSRYLVFTARDAGREEAWSTDFDLWRAPASGVAVPICLTEDNEAWDTSPVFSPNMTAFAYLAMERPGYEADRFRIKVRDWATGTTRVVAEDWDRSVRSLAWSRDGKELYVTAAHLGQVGLFAIDLESDSVRDLVTDGTVRSPQVTRDGKIVFGLDHLRSPVELYEVGPRGGPPQRLTDLNRDVLDRVEMGEPEQFTFEGWNGETVHAYVVTPAQFQPEEKYPVAFLVHGGPQGSFGNDFHYRWNPQAYAGAGYAAVMVDFHGSTGYGQAFTDSIRGDWGGKPLEDLRKGLAAALERYPWLDGERVCALGASYGGYMINWIAGTWPDRFRCLVNHDGTFDVRAMYYETEELWFPEWDNVGTPWDNPDGYARSNPALLVDRWKTPMLVVHGELDYRLPVTQGIATFNALQRRGIPSRFLYFPDENHWVLRPHNGVFWHDNVLEWLDRWTGDGATGEAPQ